jgi:hypothetical protein
VLEDHKRAYWNLRHWEESGEPYRWVEAHRGEWTHADWLRLAAKLARHGETELSRRFLDLSCAKGILPEAKVYPGGPFPSAPK